MHFVSVAQKLVSAAEKITGGVLLAEAGEAESERQIDERLHRRLLRGRHRLDLARRRPGFEASDLARLVRLYGTEADAVLGEAKAPAHLGEALGGGLTEQEVRYLKAHEWAREPEDVLWRRTKGGLHMTASELTQSTSRLERLLA